MLGCTMPQWGCLGMLDDSEPQCYIPPKILILVHSKQYQSKIKCQEVITRVAVRPWLGVQGGEKGDFYIDEF